MSKIIYYTLDCETSGLSTSQHEVLDISIIRCFDKVQITKNIKAETPHTASLDALAITKKSMSDLYLGDSKENVVNSIDAFFEEDQSSPAFRCIVGHNIAFDRKFLHALWAKCGKSFPANLWIDTIPMVRAVAKSQGIVKPKVNLEAACDFFGIKKTATFHNAKMDARNTFFLWQKLTQELKVDYIGNIKTIPHLSEEDYNLDEI
jgi:DNA polymerase III epsilon subunit-like protein